MLTLLNGGAASAHTVASLRAACDALTAGGGKVSAVSVTGTLGPGGLALPILSTAERLAKEYTCAVAVRLDGSAFEVRFSRAAAHPAVDAEPAG